MAYGFGLRTLNRFLWCPRAYYYELTRERIKDICTELALKSPCLRMHFGAIVIKNGKIVGRGFNTPIMCCENECIRDKIKIVHGTRLELCYAFHAEQMALKDAGKKKARGADLYCVGLTPDGKFLDIKHPKFVACVVCAIHENAYGIRHVFNYTVNGWLMATPKEALETAMMMAKNAESYV